MNICHFMGRLTRDPELKTFGEGKKVVNFSIAVDRKYKRGDQTVKEVSYLDCEAWDSGADLINEHFRKGDPIIVHASVKADNWETPDGQKRSKLKFRVDKFEFTIGNGNKRPKAEDKPADAPADDMVPAGTNSGEDIPF